MKRKTEVPSQRRTCRFLYSFDFQGKKIATLIFLYNGPVAVLCGGLYAILTVPLFYIGLLPGLDRGWDDGKLFSCWALWSGLLVTICVIIFWRPRSYVFLDRICISQNDNELKTQAIFSLAGLLKSSDSMLILWDPTWTERLWCLFELAAFLKSNPDRKKQLIIRPILLGPVSAAVFVTVAAAMIPIIMVPVDSNPTTVFLPVAGALLGGLVVCLCSYQHPAELFSRLGHYENISYPLSPLTPLKVLVVIGSIWVTRGMSWFVTGRWCKNVWTFGLEARVSLKIRCVRRWWTF